MDAVQAVQSTTLACRPGLKGTWVILFCSRIRSLNEKEDSELV